MISFEEFFNKVNPEKTKVKFNMNDANPDKKAWDYLKNDDPTWIDMNAWKSRNSPSNSFGNAEYVIALAQYYPYGANYYIFGGVYRIEKKIQPARAHHECRYTACLCGAASGCRVGRHPCRSGWPSAPLRHGGQAQKP